MKPLSHIEQPSEEISDTADWICDDQKLVFKDIKEGEWVQPCRRGYYMQCCGCNLIHRMDFRLVKDKIGRATIQFRSFRPRCDSLRKVRSEHLSDIMCEESKRIPKGLKWTTKPKREIEAGDLAAVASMRKTQVKRCLKS